MENYEVLGKIGEGCGPPQGAVPRNVRPRPRRPRPTPCALPPGRRRVDRTYGIVLKCRHKESGQLVAIKIFKESDEDEQVRPSPRLMQRRWAAAAELLRWAIMEPQARAHLPPRPRSGRRRCARSAFSR